jgi:autotransporter-associated beta strand protein
MRTHPCLSRAGLVGLLPFICLALHSAYADSATWNLSPNSGDWNTAANWTPANVPNGSTDIATFGQSNTTAVSISAGVEVNAITFEPGASAFTITLLDTLILTVSGSGIVNNSGVVQNFVVTSPTDEATVIQFTGDATAGDLVTFTNEGSLFIGNAETDFFDDSTAGSATFVNEGTRSNDILAGGRTQFFDRSSAGEGTFINLAGGGETVFMGDSTAAHGTFTVNGAFGYPGTMSFLENSNAGNGNFTLLGPTGGETAGGEVFFLDTASAANGFFTVNERAELLFGLASTAGNATLIANGDGSSFVFQDGSSGGTARVELFDNATLVINFHDRPGVTIGSLEGTGFVRLADRNLTVGSNDLSTTFSGIIQNGGSLEKIGAGTLTLTGANTYTGGATVSSGILLVSNTAGSGTGTGAVSVNAGTLGGSGIIAGAVTVGTNTGVQASLAPSKGAKKPATLTIQSPLTLNDDSTYTYKLETKRPASDEVIANGVTIDSGAKFSLRPSGNNALTTGQVFTVISNTSANQIAGTFHNLANGKIITVNGSNLQASYSGGDGNDLTLTVVP